MLVKDLRYDRMESVKVKFISALQEKSEVRSNLTFTYLKFLESQFCQSRKHQRNKILWDLDGFSQHLPVADS